MKHCIYVHKDFFEKGDEILIPDPGFLSYKACVDISEATTIPVEAKISNDYKIKLEDVEEKNIIKN